MDTLYFKSKLNVCSKHHRFIHIDSFSCNPIFCSGLLHHGMHKCKTKKLLCIGKLTNLIAH